MNIFKRELRAGLKPFIFWTIGLFLLVFAGMVKFTGVSAGGASINDVIAQFPRVVLATIGLVGVDIETLGGYYAILAYYALVSTSIYGIHLGSAAVNRESADKTYEFVFTKPRTRSFILKSKLAAGYVYLVVYSILNCIFSLGALAVMDFGVDINQAVLLFSLSIFFIGTLFFSIGTFCASMINRVERGAMVGNLIFLLSFVLAIGYDMLENGGLLRLITPLKYFLPAELLEGNFSLLYALITALMSAILLYLAFDRFNKKDLNAV